MTNRSRRKKNHIPTALTALLCAFATVAAILLIVLHKPGGDNDSADNQPTDSAPVITYLGSDIPVAETAEVNDYDDSLFVYDETTGYITYDSSEARSGIDVSAHQGEIDWEAVADAGIDFAIIRLGYRGSTVGSIALDEYFEANIAGAAAAGIKVGIYFYSQAVSVEEAEEEADFILEHIAGYDVTYPIVYDWEIYESENSRTAAIVDEADLTSFAVAFCDKIAEAGYTPMIYFNTLIGYFYYDFNQISDYDLWLAEYNAAAPSFYYKFDIWQYSSEGTVPGITGNVDLNVGFASFG